jgi:hypothetical protein
MSDIDIDIENGFNKRDSGPPSTLGPVNERYEPHKAITAMSWSLGMKIYHTAVPCFLAFLM